MKEKGRAVLSLQGELGSGTGQVVLNNFLLNDTGNLLTDMPRVEPRFFLSFKLRR